MNPTAKTIELLDCIGEVLCVGCRCHRRFTIFVVLFVSSRRPVGISKSYARKKKHRKHLMLKYICQTSQVLKCGSIYIYACHNSLDWEDEAPWPGCHSIPVGVSVCSLGRASNPSPSSILFVARTESTPFLTYADVLKRFNRSCS
jgi:hypothetical protein